MIKKTSRRSSPRSQTRATRNVSAWFRQQIVIKFHDHIELPYEDKVEKYFKRLGIGPWEQLKKEYPGITFLRLFRELAPERIRDLQAKAREQDPTYDPPNLLTYFLVSFPTGIKPEMLVNALLEWPIVQGAYLYPQATLAFVNPTDDPGSVNQGYLNPAPDGIGAACAWNVPGGDGTGVQFVDMEFGWTLNHDDLITHSITLLNGTNTAASAFHGTAVLGEVCASDNSLGCIGIAPNVSSVSVSSAMNSSPWDAILAAIPTLGFGDVLLIELQSSFSSGGTSWNNMLFEGFPPQFDAIRLATALGIVVVECGGNGSNDLDTFTNAAGHFILNRNDPNFKDSGAIVVGAGSPTTPHTRLAFSNYGSRVDCYGWGSGVYTCSTNSAGTATNLYTASFNGTSSAGPIIAGAGLLVQSMAQANLGYRFSPYQIRAILSDPANGTASINPPNDRIGVMPDLCSIINNALYLTPDLYIRDFIGDVGNPHGASFVCASPDIIPLQATVTNPQSTYGAGSGTENLSGLGDDIEAGQDNYIYVRVSNRGGTAANNVTATVYWSPPATLVTPNLWTLIGSDTIPVVPSGNVLTVSNAITWQASNIPGPGHYCFVALIGTANDPAPGPASFQNWNDYVLFIQNNNNAAWRNFNVVNIPPRISGPILLPFLAPGAFDIARPMRLEVVSRLPPGSRVWLEAPVELIDVLQTRSPDIKIDARRRLASLPINPYGSSRMKEVLFAANSRTQMQLVVDIPKKLRENAHEIYVRQMYENQEVGRVTWRLAPKRRKELSD
jgi:serine protease